MAFTSHTKPLLLIFSVIISNILCNNASNNTKQNRDTYPKLGSNVQNVDVPVWGPNLKSTTPWPALGARKNNGQQTSIVNAPTWVRPTPQQQSTRPISTINQSQQRPYNTYNNQMPAWVGPNNQPVLPSSIKRGQTQFNPSSGNKFMTNGNNQTYTTVDNAVGDDELREFSEVLLSKDTNNPARHVKVNYQSKTSSRSQNDEAPLPLLSLQNQVFQVPSIEKIMLLYNNYILESNVNEHYTPQEKIEENNLLDTVLSTPVMQYTRNFLIQKGKLGKDPKDFKDLLREIWFNMYSRGGGKIGSSGFEHIFLAEIKNGQVSGLHNWIYFNQEEARNEANYLGYLKKIDLGDKGAILKYHFKFHGIDKPVGSMFIGTSPELEMALYSTCFVLRADRICPLKMNGNRFIIRTYTYRYRGKNMIGSAFPEI